MIEMIKNLISCLDEETAHYRVLVKLAEKQREVLISGKLDALQENTRLQEKEVFALGPIAGKREELLRKLAASYQVKQLTLELAVKNCPLEMIEDLKSAVVGLTQTVRKLDEVNRSNGKLINNAVSFAQFTMQLVRNGVNKKTFSPMVPKESERSSFVNRVV